MINGGNDKQNALSVVEKLYIWLLLVIFGGIILHAPLSVGLGTIFPDYGLLIKSWKEILMLIAGLIAIFLMYKKKRFGLLRTPIMIAIGVYATLHLILLQCFNTGLVSGFMGLAIDLRYVLFFGLVYIAINLYPNYRKTFIKVGIAGALVVLIFALLQVFILPPDILKYLGYNINTISPYLTVDQNHAFIRINSTLRGPNPLGAYAGIVLILIVSAVTKRKIAKEKWPLVITGILAIGGVVALWASYSRSALIGTVIAIIIVLATTVRYRLSTKLWITGGVTLVIIIGGIFAVLNPSYVSNIFLHENPDQGNNINSNEGHIDSLKTGLTQLVSQPFGAGIGSTGSASLYGNKTEIIENQYLFTAHEAGWLGIGLFIYIFGSILKKLWTRRNDWLALGVFASGISLALIGLLLPVWVDDTVAIIWWGLAAVTIGLLPETKIL